MRITDAHLDLAYNALRGRDISLPAGEQAADEEGIPTVGFPNLRDGNIDLICATLFCAPAIDGKPGYRSPDEAFDAADRQLRWYETQDACGRMRVVRTADELDDYFPSIDTKASRQVASATQSPAAILLLEGADPIRVPADLHQFHARGVRIVGLAWKRTRYAGGTGAPGPLSREGIELIAQMDRLNLIHDTSHLAEESFWQLVDLANGPIIASHSNCRAIVSPDPNERQLSDDMIRAIISRKGVIGINFFDRFLLPPADYGKRRATLRDVIAHIQHICDLAGNANHVALGTDMDGGLGREEIPEEIHTSADLPKLAAALRKSDYSQVDTEKILGGNWRRFFTDNLPR